MKSHESDLLELARVIYDDACAKCTADVSDLRDLMTIRSRVKHEGLSFLTITLPQFAKDFERSLAAGAIDPACFRGFERISLDRDASYRTGRKHGAIPVFLQGMLGLLFDRESGRILDDPHHRFADDASVLVGSVRQICRAFQKIELDCTSERTEAAIEGFVSTELDLAKFQPKDHLSDLFGRVADLLWSPCLVGINPFDLVPKHGPGQTAERISGNQKYAWSVWYERIEPYFPFLGNALSLGSYSSKEFDSVTFVPVDQELPVRVTPVPKTLRGPRIIAIEPLCMQYAQQAIRSVLYSSIERSRLAGGRVNFTDQSTNQKMALISSKTGQYATIDLSEASDRVPLELASRMFESNPVLWDAVLACRSTSAQLPDGRVIGPLKKFASMGSALCFPIESMYFYTICVVALLRLQNLPVSHANVAKVSRDVYVYGDDIIVPARYAVATLDYLQEYNCKVNMSKSFWNGKFRESCGIDAYDGYEVTPTYLRKLRPKSRRYPDRIVSWVKTANLFYKKGYWRTSSHMFDMCERIVGSLPYVSEDSPALGRISFLRGRSIGRWNNDLQRLEVRAWVAEPVYRTDALDGYGALAKSLSLLPEENLLPLDRDPLHLERTAQYGAVALKRRWVPALIGTGEML